MIANIIKYVEHFLAETKEENKEVNEVILKSALVYQYLYHKHFDDLLTVKDVLEMNNGEIGLIGNGNGLSTKILERLFG